MNVDQGVTFGLWPDQTSKLIYWDLMPVMLNGVDTSGRVGDLGGGNGIIKTWVPQAVTIDVDETKQPDIVDNILTHVGDYDLVIIRYVLHYLDDHQVRALLRHLSLNHDGQILLIQFVNDDLEAKQANSVNETKWFRREDHLESLIAHTHLIVDRKSVGYRVGADFYRNRLGHPNPTPHNETVVGYLLERRLP